MRWLAVVGALAGCGRIGFAPVTAAAPWEGDFTLEPPQAVGTLNSAAFESECFVTADGLTMFFASARPGGLGMHDVYSASRSALDAAFGSVVHHPELSTVDQDGRYVTFDGVHAYLWSSRAGGLGGTDIWEVSPATVDLIALNTAGFEYDPWPSADGLRLYYDYQGDIAVTERASIDEVFGPPRVLAELATPDFEDNPAVSADERFLVFSSTRASGLGGRDIYFARRPDRDAAFSAPVLLPVVNTAFDDYEACITEGGELYFSSNRPGGAGDDDIYRAPFVPL